jgi:phosphoglycolate phosphatase
MPRYTYILFDLDGTIIDPKQGITNSVQYSLSKQDINADLEELVKFIGPPLAESFQKYYPGIDPEQAVRDYRKYFSEKGVLECILYDKITELFESLKETDKDLVVATSKATIFAEQIINHFRLGQYFTHIFGSDLDYKGKSKTQIVDEALAQNSQHSKSQSIMVGDRIHDIIGAHNNGIHSLFVTYGYGASDRFNKVKPTYICQTVEEMHPILLS